jgi:hypothetical protein
MNISTTLLYGLLLLTVISFFVGLFSGQLPETDPTFENQNKAAWQACIDSGGVPLRSQWSSQMADCKYPNKLKDIK